MIFVVLKSCSFFSHNFQGIVKPDIVFFGEELPKRFYFYLKDMLQTDLVLVMGTSLEVIVHLMKVITDFVLVLVFQHTLETALTVTSSSRSPALTVNCL